MVLINLALKGKDESPPRFYLEEEREREEPRVYYGRM